MLYYCFHKNFCVYKESKHGEYEKVVMRLTKEGLGILKIV